MLRVTQPEVHAQGGRVEIRLGQVGSSVTVQVSDTGQGIKPDFLPHVFERFRQADSSYSRSQGGLGLGLSIVRHLVELHGGTARAQSPGEGQGATFSLHFPLLAVRPSASSRASHFQPGDRSAGEARGSKSPLRLEGLHVLVVDDEADSRDLIATILQQHGCRVTAVASVAEALGAMQRWKPDLLVSDIGMPLEDGYELIRKVVALEPERVEGIPAIALTGYASEADRKRTLSAGYRAYVSKPVEPDELVEMIASLARRSGT
jgi:CheY-like chemotaxis protein